MKTPKSFLLFSAGLLSGLALYGAWTAHADTPNRLMPARTTTQPMPQVPNMTPHGPTGAPVQLADLSRRVNDLSWKITAMQLKLNKLEGRHKTHRHQLNVGMVRSKSLLSPNNDFPVIISRFPGASSGYEYTKQPLE